jgi:hypothetical protein
MGTVNNRLERTQATDRDVGSTGAYLFKFLPLLKPTTASTMWDGMEGYLQRAGKGGTLEYLFRRGTRILISYDTPTPSLQLAALVLGPVKDHA